MSNREKDERLAIMCRHVARHYQGDVSAQAFDWFDAISQQFFDGRLPQPFILTAITPYGACIGLTKRYDRPVILLHPSLVARDKSRFYTLLHEAIHVQTRYIMHEQAKNSHNNPSWISECNRIAKILGYDVVLGGQKVKRIAKNDGGGLHRVGTGTVSYACTSSFPDPLEIETGQPLPPIDRWVPGYVARS